MIMSTTWYAFGAVGPGSISVSATTFDVWNSGNVSATLGLSVTDPAPWVSVMSGPAAFDQYELDAQFNFPGPPAGWSSTNHALRPASPGPDFCDGTRFAGANEDGVSVGMGQTRHLWVRFLAPVLTAQVDTQPMVITITAQP